jgi:hypothetical protein
VKTHSKIARSANATAATSNGAWTRRILGLASQSRRTIRTMSSVARIPKKMTIWLFWSSSTVRQLEVTLIRLSRGSGSNWMRMWFGS